MKLIKKLAKMHRERIEEKVAKIINDTDAIVYGESLCGKEKYIIAYDKTNKKLLIIDYDEDNQYQEIELNNSNLKLTNDVLSIVINNDVHHYKIPYLKISNTVNPIIQTKYIEALHNHLKLDYPASIHIVPDKLYS